MSSFRKLKPYEQKEVITGLIFDGLTYEQIHVRYGILPEDIADILNERAIEPYRALCPEPANHDGVHRKTVWGWIRNGLLVSAVAYVSIFLIQSILGGFETQIVTDALAYVTSPLSSILKLGLAVSFIVFCLYQFFPILSTFINEKVNTVSLKETFLSAKPEAKLNFLAIIVLALCILVGLVFSAKGQERECIIQTAHREVGVIEVGGNNKGARIDHYRSVALSKTVKNYADPWCGYFVAYVYTICKIPFTVKFSPRARDWFQDSEKIVWRRNFQYGVVKRRPQRGDLIGYMFRAGTIGHIEILYDWKPESGYFISIGGNTSNAGSVLRDANTQDGVRMKKRKIETAYIIANHIGT